jgi:hypothetical protein
VAHLESNGAETGARTPEHPIQIMARAFGLKKD